MDPSAFTLGSEVKHDYPSKWERVAVVILHGGSKERVQLSSG
jgi:hypothetical protein